MPEYWSAVPHRGTGEMEGLGPSMRGQKRQIMVRPHPLSSTCHTPAGSARSAKGWRKSDNGRGVMVRAMALLGIVQK